MIQKLINGKPYLFFFSKKGHHFEISIHDIPLEELREIGKLIGAEPEELGDLSNPKKPTFHTISVDGISLYS